ncbi:MAG: peptide-methionine (R)-S-oxide reductase MsrB [Caulobacteraceae bacterium]|nr:peptide-methionine (R)-S-oxide reductase MsrB [Caulobacteraceae bacterium]
MLTARRLFLLAVPAFAIAPRAFAADAYAASPWRKLTPSDWKTRLPPKSFSVLREEDTEAPFSSPLNNEHRRGTFACLGCGLPLFKSDWKFNSGTGWPSFYTAIPGAVGTKADFKLVLEERTEYHCARCLGHQGHIFHDGPKPTGLRYCNNGVALKFIPA